MCAIRESAVAVAVYVYEHGKETGLKDDEAMTKALEAASKTICTCGKPFTLGVVHRKNNPCFVYEG